MKKGFTLIELLAVIVILAIIALIATPIVLGIINDSKESVIIRSAEFYVDAVKNSIMQENMKLGGTLNPSECIIDNNGNATCDGTYLEIEVDGEKPSGGSITFNEGKATGVNLTFGNKNVSMNLNGELVLGDIVESKLAPGLYDENDVLIVSWEKLVLDYDIETAIESGNATEILNNYSNASKLVISNSVTSVGDSAFYGCTNIRSVIIPNSITTIGTASFMDCSDLSNVIFSDTLIRIGDGAFASTPLSNITIPNSVITIDANAFRGCLSLTEINYKGTEAEWIAISKGENWDFDTPSNKVINYNYTG